jgi:hypothetical protein
MILQYYIVGFVTWLVFSSVSTRLAKRFGPAILCQRESKLQLFPVRKCAVSHLHCFQSKIRLSRFGTGPVFVLACLPALTDLWLLFHLHMFDGSLGSCLIDVRKVLGKGASASNVSV